MALFSDLRPAVNNFPDGLTTTEERLLPFLCAGWTDRQIASELGLREEEVERHVESCLGRFGVRSRGGLALRLLAGESPNKDGS